MDTFNKEHEKALLNIMLMDTTLIDLIKLRVNPDNFQNPKYKLIFKTIIEQWERFHHVDFITLQHELRTDVYKYVLDLMDVVTSTAGWEYYADEIVKNSLVHRIVTDLEVLRGTVNTNNVNDKIGEMSNMVTDYLKLQSNPSKTMQNLVIELTEEVEAAYKNKKELLGYDTGWSELNSITDGFQTQNLYVLGARPSIGKTACAMAILSYICKTKIPSAFISLEMSAKSILYRMVASEAKLPAWQIKKGACFNYKEGTNKFIRAMQTITEYPLNFYDTNIKNENQIYSTIRYEAKVNGTKFFVIDHLGLVKFLNPTAQRYADIGNFTSGLKDLAKELDVCILLLCQCGRAAEGKEPTLAELRESGNIEQDADVIMFLHREREVDAASIPTKLVIAKNRDGRLGTVNLCYLSDYTKFIEDKGVNNDEVGKQPDLRG